MFLKISFDESSRDLNKTKFLNYRTDTIIITVIYYSARDLRSVGRDPKKKSDRHRKRVFIQKQKPVAADHGSRSRKKSDRGPSSVATEILDWSDPNFID